MPVNDDFSSSKQQVKGQDQSREYLEPQRRPDHEDEREYLTPGVTPGDELYAVPDSPAGSHNDSGVSDQGSSPSVPARQSISAIPAAFGQDMYDNVGQAAPFDSESGSDSEDDEEVKAQDGGYLNVDATVEVKSVDLLLGLSDKDQDQKTPLDIYKVMVQQWLIKNKENSPPSEFLKSVKSNIDDNHTDMSKGMREFIQLHQLLIQSQQGEGVSGENLLDLSNLLNSFGFDVALSEPLQSLWQRRSATPDRSGLKQAKASSTSLSAAFNAPDYMEPAEQEHYLIPNSAGFAINPGYSSGPNMRKDGDVVHNPLPDTAGPEYAEVDPKYYTIDSCNGQELKLLGSKSRIGSDRGAPVVAVVQGHNHYDLGDGSDQPTANAGESPSVNGFQPVYDLGFITETDVDTGIEQQHTYDLATPATEVTPPTYDMGSSHEPHYDVAQGVTPQYIPHGAQSSSDATYESIDTMRAGKQLLSLQEVAEKDELRKESTVDSLANDSFLRETSFSGLNDEHILEGLYKVRIIAASKLLEVIELLKEIVFKEQNWFQRNKLLVSVSSFFGVAALVVGADKLEDGKINLFGLLASACNTPEQPTALQSLYVAAVENFGFELSSVTVSSLLVWRDSILGSAWAQQLGLTSNTTATDLYGYLKSFNSEQAGIMCLEGGDYSSLSLDSGIRISNTAGSSMPEMKEGDTILAKDTFSLTVSGGNAAYYHLSGFENVRFLKDDGSVLDISGFDSRVITAEEWETLQVAGSFSEYYGSVKFSVQVEVQATDAPEISELSEVQAISFDLQPVAGSVAVDYTADYSAVEDKFTEIDVRFTPEEVGETTKARLLTGPAGMQVQERRNSQWNDIAINSDGEFEVTASRRVRVKLPQGNNQKVAVGPCVDYSAGEHPDKCDYDPVILTFDVNYAEPTISIDSVSISFIEGGSYPVSQQVADSNIETSRTSGGLRYIYSNLGQVQLVNADGEAFIPNDDGEIVLSEDDLVSTAFKGLTDTSYTEIGSPTTVDFAVEADGLDGSVIRTDAQSVNVAIAADPGVFVHVGETSHTGVANEWTVFNNTVTVEDGEVVLSRQLTGLPNSTQLQIFFNDEWLDQAVFDGEPADLDADSLFRLMCPAGNHTIILTPCVDAGLATPVCDQAVDLTFNVAHPDMEVNFSCPADLSWQEDAPLSLQAVRDSMNVTITNGAEKQLVLSALGDSSVINADGVIAPDAQGAVRVNVADLASTYLYSATDTYGDKSINLALGVSSNNAPDAVVTTDAEACSLHVSPVYDGATVSGLLSGTAYSTQQIVFDITATAHQGESVVGRELHGLTAGMRVFVGDSEISITDGVAVIAAEGEFAIQSPVGINNVDLVLKEDIGEGVIITRDPIQLTLDSLEVLSAEASLSRTSMVMAEGERAPATQFELTVANAQIVSYVIRTTDQTSIYHGATKLVDTELTILKDELSQYSIAAASEDAYGSDKGFSIQANVLLADGSPAQTDIFNASLNVTAVADLVHYEGDASVSAFIGDKAVVAGQITTAEGETVSELYVSSIPSGVTLERKNSNDSWVSVSLTDGAAIISNPVDGKVELRLGSSSERDFNLTIQAKTKYDESDLTKTHMHDAQTIGVEFASLPSPIITVPNPTVVVNEGSRVDLTHYTNGVSVENGSVHSYILSTVSGTKFYRDGVAQSGSTITVPAADVGLYEIGTPNATDYGTKSFSIQAMATDLSGELVTDDYIHQLSITFSPVAGSNPSSNVLATYTTGQETWQAIQGTYSGIQAGEYVEKIRLSGIPSHVTVEYLNGSSWVKLTPSGGAVEYTLPTPNNVNFRIKSATQQAFNLGIQPYVNYGASSLKTDYPTQPAGLTYTCVLPDCQSLGADDTASCNVAKAGFADTDTYGEAYADRFAACAHHTSNPWFSEVGLFRCFFNHDRAVPYQLYADLQNSRNCQTFGN